MVATAAVVFGLVSLARLPLDLMPELSWPTLTVRTDLPGAAPEEVEAQVARPMETAVATVSGLKSLESVSRAGRADIILRFSWGRDMDDAAQTVRERLALVPLPREAERPLLLRQDPDDRPVLRLGLAGDRPPRELRRLAEQLLARRLEGMDGVAAVTVRGGEESEIVVQVDPGLLRARGIQAAALRQALADHNVDLAGGQMLEGDTLYLVRTVARIENAEDVAAIRIPTRSGVSIPLGEIANVEERGRPPSVVTRAGGDTAVEVSVYRSGGANLVQVSRDVRDRVFGTKRQREFAERPEKERARLPPMVRAMMSNYLVKQLPEDLRVEQLQDQAVFVETALRTVRSAVITGGFLAVLVLLLFLRDGRATSIIAVSIPLSVAASFAPLYLTGVTLNLMSLGGLALVVGMLVDNSVVVLEAITRKLEEGLPRTQAALEGAGDVAGAVVASTLTTVAVFAPLGFVEGIAGQLFQPLAITVVVGMLASLAVALTVVPMLAALQFDLEGSEVPERLMDVSRMQPAAPMNRFQARMKAWAQRERRGLRDLLAIPGHLMHMVAALAATLSVGITHLLSLLSAAVLRASTRLNRWLIGGLKRGLKPASARFTGGIGGLEKRYMGFLGNALTAPVRWLVLAAVLLVASLALVRGLGQQLLPEVAQGLLVARLDLPVGSTLQESQALAESLEPRIGELEGVEAVYTVVGVEEGVDAAADKGPHSTEFWITVATRSAPQQTERRLREALRAIAVAEPGITARVEAPSLLELPPPVEVALLTNDLELGRSVSEQVEAAMAQQPRLRDVERDLRAGYPELRVQYRRDALRTYGLDLGTTANTVRDLLRGSVATRIDRPEQILDLRVLLAGAEELSRDQLAAFNVNPAGFPPIRLDAVAEFVDAIGPSEIRHLEGRRAARLTAFTTGADLSAAVDEAWSAVRSSGLPDTIDVEMRGQAVEMQASTRSLWMALALALFLVYAIMASQFEDLRAPFVILFSVPLAIVGVVATLLLVNLQISVLVFIGLIVLVGIVVNNAIVLITTVGQLRERGAPLEEALLEAGRLRLRPILITTFTTVLGLLPMALLGGQGMEIRAPLAWTVMGGLLSSTLLTLVVLPLLYRLMIGGLPASLSATAASAVAQRRAEGDRDTEAPA
jgi:HAE1 family hydrophobic/amphiphilic exporter-1